PGAVRDPETPGVPGTSNDVRFQIPFAQGCPHVWAYVVDGVVLSSYTKQCNQPTAEADRLPLSLADFMNFAHRLKSIHTVLVCDSRRDARFALVVLSIFFYFTSRSM